VGPDLRGKNERMMQGRHTIDRQAAYFTAEDAEENKNKKNKDEACIHLYFREVLCVLCGEEGIPLYCLRG
jgi:hypothetical protein